MGCTHFIIEYRYLHVKPEKEWWVFILNQGNELKNFIIEKGRNKRNSGRGKEN